MVNYEQILSARVKEVQPSGIRRFFELAAKMPHAISLGVGEPDFETPWQIRRAGIQSLEKGQTFYTSNWGLAELRNQLKMLAAAGDLEGMWYALEQAKDLPWGRQAEAYDDVYREARDQDELYVPYIPILDESRELDNELVEASAQQTVSNQNGRMQAQQSLTVEETEGVLGEKQKRNARQALDGLSTIDRAELLGSQLQQAVGEQEMIANSRRIEQEKAKDGVFYGYDPYHPSDFDRAHRAGNTQNFGFLKYGAYGTKD